MNELNSSTKDKKRMANRVNFYDSLEGVFWHDGNLGQEITGSTWVISKQVMNWILDRSKRRNWPHITKAMRPNLDMVYSTASFNKAGCLTSARTGNPLDPWILTVLLQSGLSGQVWNIYWVNNNSKTQYTCDQRSRLLHHEASRDHHINLWRHLVRDKTTCHCLCHTPTYSTSPSCKWRILWLSHNQPIQNQTFPLKISILNTVVESTIGTTNSFSSIAQRWWQTKTRWVYWKSGKHIWWPASAACN